MIVVLLVLSALVAGTAAVAAFLLGWGIWASILIYMLGGSLTLVLLATLVARFFPDPPADDDP